MALALAIVCSATLAGLIGWVVSARHTRRRLALAIDERSSASDPLEAHRRALEAQVERGNTSDLLVEQLTLALDALTSGVVIADRNGNVITQNLLAREVRARSHEQTLVDSTTADVIAAAVGGRPNERELELFGPPSRTLAMHGAPISDGAQLVGAVAVIDDVTEHRRVEAVRRDFVANLSHELRTPVGALSLLAEMLRDEDDVATREQLSERVVFETERLAATIDDLLELSRIESASQRFDDLIDVRDLIDGCIARTSTIATAAGVKVGALVPDDRVVLLGNRDQLLSAMVNLVENAVKYSSEGDSVEVRARIVDEQVELSVRDTGRGIPARDLDRIFERFYRVDRSRDSSTGGTGIGLSIVRHVALNHGGSVSVESYEGEGSTFVITLPHEHAGSSHAGDAAAEVVA